jgi:hypothetical protein
MLGKRRNTFVLGLAAALIGLPAWAQEAKKESDSSSIDRALEQSKLSGVPILAVAGTET